MESQPYMPGVVYHDNREKFPFYKVRTEHLPSGENTYRENELAMYTVHEDLDLFIQNVTTLISSVALILFSQHRGRSLMGCGNRPFDLRSPDGRAEMSVATNGHFPQCIR